ncbi:MAG: cyclodeaminase/cyclohydrolase family protein, partial [Elusimicrobia bacterium]|nr:cyclodeaminase/cyclohydrolase family protein [Elusimicrobiota bacterium]
ADMAAGKDIARRLRASGGGLPCLRAKEILLERRAQVQISTVLTDYKTTSIKRALEECARLAREHGAAVKTAEIVGLLPRQALVDFALESLPLENFNPDVQILESRLEAAGLPAGKSDEGWQAAAAAVSDALAGTEATPGGGSAAGIAGAMGCALAVMATAISLKSKKLDAAKRTGLERSRERFSAWKADFQRLTAEDAAAFDGFMAAAALPKDDAQRPLRMQEALLRAAQVPLETARLAGEACALARQALALCGASVASDMGCAAHLLRASARCAAENVRINLGGIKDSAVSGRLEAELRKALEALPPN